MRGTDHLFYFLAKALSRRPSAPAQPVLIFLINQLGSPVSSKANMLNRILGHEASFSRYHKKPETYERIARKFLARNCLDRALGEIQQGLRRHPSHLSLLITATDVYHALGKHECSLVHGLSLITYYPKDWNGYARAARSLLALNRAEDARRQIRQGLKVCPNQVNLLSAAADAYHALGRHSRSLNFAQLLVKHNPDECRGYVCAARSLLALSRTEESLHIALQGLGLFPTQLELLIAASDAYRVLGKYKNSLFYSNLLITHYPESWNGYARAAQSLLALDRAKRAREKIRQGLDISPSQISLLIVASDVFRALGQVSSSLKYCELLIAHHPSCWNGYGRAAQDLLSLNLPSRALGKIQQGLEMLPLNASLLAIASDIYRRLGKRELSLECSEMLVCHHPSSLQGYVRVAQDLVSLCRYREAGEKIKVGMCIFPQEPSLVSIRFLLNSLMGNDEECHNDADKIIAMAPHMIDGYAKKTGLLVQQGMDKESQDVIRLARLRVGDKMALSLLIREQCRLVGRREEAALISSSVRAECTPDRRKACIELSKDFLVLSRVDAGLQILRSEGIINRKEVVTIKNLLSCGVDRQLSSGERDLIGRLEIFPHYSDPLFNALPEMVVEASKECPCIVLIHVGKCGGESIKSALRRDFGAAAKIFEYHLYDSNILLSELISCSQANNNVYFVICVRDPLERWVSAFNYDLHIYVLSRLFYAPQRAHEAYSIYPTAALLARGLSKGDKLALEFTQLRCLAFGHMAMGISWYLPEKLIHKLPLGRSFLVRLNEIQGDYKSLQRTLWTKLFPGEVDFGMPIWQGVANLNSRWRHRYCSDIFSRVSDLARKDASALLEYLRHDYLSLKCLTCVAIAGGADRVG